MLTGKSEENCFENIGINSVQLPEAARSRTAIESDPEGVQEQIKQKQLEQFSEFENFNVL